MTDISALPTSRRNNRASTDASDRVAYDALIARRHLLARDLDVDALRAELHRARRQSRRRRNPGLRAALIAEAAVAMTLASTITQDTA